MQILLSGSCRTCSASIDLSQAFYPCGAAGEAGSKPWVSVAGDGAQKFYIVSPIAPTDTADWRYNTSVLYDCKGTVGQQSFADLNGDGCVEMFVPCYDSSTVAVFSFSNVSAV